MMGNFDDVNGRVLYLRADVLCLSRPVRSEQSRTQTEHRLSAGDDRLGVPFWNQPSSVCLHFALLIFSLSFQLSRVFISFTHVLYYNVTLTYI